MLDALPISDENRALLAQFIRYGITGGFVTVIGVAAYGFWARVLGYPTMVATIIAYIVSMALGYIVHSRFSFAGHGSGGRHATRSMRFFLVSLISLSLNEFWTWLFTVYWQGDWWWPVPGFVFLTPVAVFALNRKWVFA